MKPSKQFIQIGFKKKPKVSKDSFVVSARRVNDKENIIGLQNTTQTDYLLETQTNQKPKRERESIKPKLPARKRFQSFEQSSYQRKNSRSFIQNISHRSRSKSKLDEKLDQMLINQRVKQQLASQKRSKQKYKPSNDTIPLNQLSKLNKSIRQATLSKYINQLTQQNQSIIQKKTKNEEYIVNELGNIINLIDGLFGVSRSEKLVNSFRSQKTPSIPCLIATIKNKLETVGKESHHKSQNLTKTSN